MHYSLRAPRSFPNSHALTDCLIRTLAEMLPNSCKFTSSTPVPAKDFEDTQAFTSYKRAHMLLHPVQADVVEERKKLANIEDGRE